jgi:glycosyltransferase involved in cell wall biosynthesis
MLSIIIPALNEEKCLPTLLKSIKKQDFKDYEIIIADANSKDKTRKRARAYGCKLARGGKPPAGRNSGARISKGSILFFIDADCQVGKDFLAKAMKQFKGRKLDAAGCYVLPLSNRFFDNLIFSIFNFWIYTTQLFYPNAPGSGIFCKKRLHEKINGFDETLKLSEDMDYVRRASKFGKFGILKKLKTYTSMRRFDREGRAAICWKLFLSALYRIFLGEIRTNIFRYRLNYKK